MTPPRETGTGTTAEAPDAPPAVFACPPAAPESPARLEVLRHRADFLKAASARRFPAGSFLLQARDRRDDLPLVRVGFTASKKIGNAVLRNRAKRRLRALARQVLTALARPGWDYVLVARPAETIDRPYDGLCADLARAVDAIHRARK